MWWHMRRNQNPSYCVWNVIAHAQETRFRLTAFETWWHVRRNQIPSYCVWNVIAHAQKPDFVLLHLKPDFVFRQNWRVYLNRQGVSVHSTIGNRGVLISVSNAGYNMFRDSVKSTGYPFHSPVSPSVSLPCVTVYHHISIEIYYFFLITSFFFYFYLLQTTAASVWVPYAVQWMYLSCPYSVPKCFHYILQ
jgi:hypothetical protein